MVGPKQIFRRRKKGSEQEDSTLPGFPMSSSAEADEPSVEVESTAEGGEEQQEIDPLAFITKRAQEMDQDELRQAQRMIEHLKERHWAQQIQAACKAGHEIAQRYGMTLNDLLCGGGRLERTIEADQKRYVCPSNPRLRWSGRGNKPSWVIAYEQQGWELKDMDILGTGRPKQASRRGRAQ